MDGFFKVGFFVLLLVVLLMYVLMGRTIDQKDMEATRRLDVLAREAQALRDSNMVLKAEVAELLDSIAAMQAEVEGLEEQKNETIKYYEAQIRRVGDYNVSELQGFFAERYGQRGDTTQGDSR